MSKIKLLIVDDQKMVREGLKLILDRYERFECVGEAENGFEAITLAKKLRPDVVLMDLRMPEMNGVDATYRILQSNSEIKVLILTTFNEEAYILKALEYGASGYVLKDIGGDEIVKAIETVLKGHIMLQPEVTSNLIKTLSLGKKDKPLSFDPCDLTLKEREIGNLIAKGKTNKEIALLLSIKEGTVKNHVSSILLKYGLSNRTEIALRFQQNS